VEWRGEPFERDGPYDGARDGLHPAAVGGVEDEPVALSLHGDAALVDGAMLEAAQQRQVVEVLLVANDIRARRSRGRRIACHCV